MKKCGVCSKPVLSDASKKGFCATCGMGLGEKAFAAGKSLLFCGQRCLEVFAMSRRGVIA